MKTLIVVYSYHHNNTLKIAQAMAKILKADLKDTSEVNTDDLKKYDLIGLGSGIDSGRHYKQLLDFAQTMPTSIGQNCFVFSTCGVVGKKKLVKDHFRLNSILKEKKYNLLGDFSCKGFNTNVFLKYIGGINKGHPNQEDINNAKDFAFNILNS